MFHSWLLKPKGQELLFSLTIFQRGLVSYCWEIQCGSSPNVGANARLKTPRMHRSATTRVIPRSICTGKSRFLSSHSESLIGTPPEVRFPTWKVRKDLTSCQNPKMACSGRQQLPTETCSNILGGFFFFCLICVSLNQSHVQHCPVSTCGHVATVFVSTKYTQCSALLATGIANG